MHREGWKSGLVWIGLAVAVCLAVASAGRDDPGSRAAPGHKAKACGACRAHQSSRGPALPYELGDDNIRFLDPVAKAGSGAGDGG